jgi:lysophospholipase L1-like esterase/GH24 family phage-related lysozyme (muramidase)
MPSSPSRVVNPIETLERRTLLSVDAISNGTSDVSPADTELVNYVLENVGLTQHVVKIGKEPPTIGAGFNLKQKGARALIESLGLDYKQLLREAKTPETETSITTEQAMQLLNADLTTSIATVQKYVATFNDLSHRQQVGLVDLAHAVGTRFKGLKSAIKALEAGDLAGAIAKVSASKYVQRELTAERLAGDLVLIQSLIDVGGPSQQPDPDPVPPSDAKNIAFTPEGHAVRVGACEIKLASGEMINVPGGLLNIDDPEISRGHTYEGTAPGNYTGQSSSLRWPDSSINLKPAVDTLILGGVYHAVIPQSVVVRDTSGHVYQRDVDYMLNEEWGQILNRNNGLGAVNTNSLEISYDIVKQRLDLIQVLPDGTLSVKKGQSQIVCPALPEPDAGATALAGVYVFTLDGARDSGFVLQQRDILPIKPASPVEPINPAAIPNTLAKLRSGGNVNIAYFGDSITLGGEAGKWWSDRSKVYTTLVTNGLKARFPQATITETLAAKGGTDAEGSIPDFQKSVIDVSNAGNKIDVVVINMGMNDKGKPTLDPFKGALKTYIDMARGAGIEVVLVSPMQSNPYYEPNQTDRVTRLEIASAIKEVATEKTATYVDVYQAWVNQSTQGVLPFSQLHNTFNHPGPAGHKVYADTILRAFPTS